MFLNNRLEFLRKMYTFISCSNTHNSSKRHLIVFSDCKVTQSFPSVIPRVFSFSQKFLAVYPPFHPPLEIQSCNMTYKPSYIFLYFFSFVIPESVQNVLKSHLIGLLLDSGAKLGTLNQQTTCFNFESTVLCNLTRLFSLFIERFV